MGLPFYKEIVLQTLTAQEVENILSSKNEKHSPLTINLLQLGVLQNKALQMFETIMLKNKLSYNFPYAIYFISNIDNYRGSLSVFKTTSELPAFFKGKEKIPNVKESQLLNKIELKAKKIEYITDTQIENLSNITLGAKLQKELYNLSLEGHYLEQIRNHLIKTGKAHDEKK
jgi:hypothetical protein